MSRHEHEWLTSVTTDARGSIVASSTFCGGCGAEDPSLATARCTACGETTRVGLLDAMGRCEACEPTVPDSGGTAWPAPRSIMERPEVRG